MPPSTGKWMHNDEQTDNKWMNRLTNGWMDYFLFFRYLHYITELVCPNPVKPHPLSLMLLMLKLTSVPLYNESR